MQHKAVYLLFCKFTLHVSGVNHTHHQYCNYSLRYWSYSCAATSLQRGEATTPIIRSTQNRNYSLRYWSYFCAATSLQRGQATTPISRSTQNFNYSLRYWPYFCAATSLQCDQASLATLEGGSCTVPEAVVTVLCTLDHGCG